MSGGRERPPVMRWTVLAIVVLAVAVVPAFVADRYLLRVLTFVGINVIMAGGLSLLFGYTGQVSLGHAAFYGLGAYGSAYLSKAGLPWLLALVAGVTLAAAGGLLLALPSLRLRGHYLAMATLGFGEIVHIAFTEAERFTGGANGMQRIPPPSLGSLTIDTAPGNYLLVWGCAGVVLLLASNMVALRPGRALRAIHGTEIGASACGIDTVRVKTQVFVLSAALAGLAGVLYAHYVGFVSPSSFSLNLSIALVAMVALGGMGSLPGAVAGAVLLTLLPFADALIPGLSREAAAALQDWESDTYGVVLILVMLFMPQGLAGAARDVARSVRDAIRSRGREGVSP